ncbi:MAG: hypothetical protein ACOCRK_03720 [bacterium]
MKTLLKQLDKYNRENGTNYTIDDLDKLSAVINSQIINQRKKITNTNSLLRKAAEEFKRNRQ